MASNPFLVPRPAGDQLALTHARLVIHQLERQAAVTAGLAQRCGIQAGQLSLLSGVADALTRRSDPDVTLRDVLAATLDAAGISKGALILRDATGRLALRQDVGFSEAERSALQHFFGHGALLADIINRGREHRCTITGRSGRRVARHPRRRPPRRGANRAAHL